MFRILLVVVFVFGACCATATADLVTVPLSFVPATSSFNKLNLNLHASYNSSSDSDTSSTTVTNGSTAILNLDYTFDPSTYEVNSVNSIEFTGGTFGLNNTHFDLTFYLIYAVDVDATNIAGTFDSISPPGSISGGSTATFPTEEHYVVLNQGTVAVDSLLYDTSFNFGDPPIETTTTGTGTITTTLTGIVSNVASYDVEMILPVDFDEDLPTGDDSFTARLEGNGTFKATGSFTMALANHPPVGVVDSYSTNEDTTYVCSQISQGVLANDTDLDSDPLTSYKITNPLHGSVTLDETGTFTYIPNENFNGMDSFTYKAYDGTDLSDETTVSIDVIAVNDAPVAVDDYYECDAGSMVNTYPFNGVLVNDTDIDSTTITAEKLSDPEHGSLLFYSSGAFKYIPAAGFFGTDSFTYHAKDATDYSNIATVTLKVLSDIPGDATHNGIVDSEDAAILAENWGQSVSGAEYGDFNGDGIVDAKDASIMAANWGDHNESVATTIPEPSSLMLIFAGLLAVCLGRKRTA